MDKAVLCCAWCSES